MSCCILDTEGMKDPQELKDALQDVISMWFEEAGTNLCVATLAISKVSERGIPYEDWQEIIDWPPERDTPREAPSTAALRAYLRHGLGYAIVDCNGREFRANGIAPCCELVRRAFPDHAIELWRPGRGGRDGYVLYRLPAMNESLGDAPATQPSIEEMSTLEQQREISAAKPRRSATRSVVKERLPKGPTAGRPAIH